MIYIERSDKMLIRYINIPEEIYSKMIEYIEIDNHEEVNDFILDVLESYIEIHSNLEDDVLGEEHE